MQGFNKYYPPDYDSRQTSSLNQYRGVHALGVRAKDIDKGILVVRWVQVLLSLHMHDSARQTNRLCILCAGLNFLSTFGVDIATPILAQVSDTMLKNAKLATTIPHQSMPFGASVTYVLGGLKSGQIPK